MSTGFFAYPFDPPSLSETIRSAVDQIHVTDLTIVPWENARVGGRVIIREICRLIDEAQLFLADLTGINPNVMFELGYAIGRNKRIWVVLDSTRPATKREYDQLRLLTGIGYCGYVNSRDISNGFYRDHPFTDIDATIWTEDIEPLIRPGERSTTLYLKGGYETEAVRRTTELVARLQREGLPSTIDDPNETRTQPLAWYAQRTFSAIGVLAHFCSENRAEGRVHNARQALVAGLAFGLGKPLLMVAEHDYTAPLDYQDLLVNYSTARECLSHAQGFLDEIFQQYRDSGAQERLRTVQLATELKGLRLGEYVAELEADRLSEYFVDTEPYQSVISGSGSIFVGRKGTGKTASLIRAADEIGSDQRNLVVVIQPAGYDLEGLTTLLTQYQQRDTKGYLIDSLWKFLVYSEIAQVAVRKIEERAGGPSTTVEDQLLAMYYRANSPISGDFAVRLERALASLKLLPGGSGIEANRTAISEALHGSILADLRRLLGEVLESRERVAVLVDNLDKTWSRDQDLDTLSSLIFGLLGSASSITADFSRNSSKRKPVKVTLAIFLRSDIFQYIKRVAREPDKLRFTPMFWNDRRDLLHVLDERLVAATSAENATNAWSRYFASSVSNMSAREYFASRVLPRPRDILFLVTAAVAIAINSGHFRVEEEDIFEAEKRYSRYALDTIEAEATAALRDANSLLYEFMGASEILDENTIQAIMTKGGIVPSDFQSTLDYLVAYSFLGREIREDEFSFADDEESFKKNEILARNLCEAKRRRPRYKINIPYHSYLEISSAGPN